MGLLEAHELLVPHPVREEVSRIGSGRLEFGMGTAIGSTDQRQWMLEDLAERLLIVIDPAAHPEFSLQIFLYRQVEHHVHRMLTLGGCNLRNSTAREVFVLLGCRFNNRFFEIEPCQLT